MPSELPGDKAAEIARRVAARQPYSQIAREMRLSISTVSKYASAKVAEEDTPKPEGPRAYSESGDDAKVEYPLRARVVTLEDAIAHGQVDTNVWYVDRWECTSWELGFVRKDGEADVLPLWRVKLYLKRKLPKPFLDAAELTFKQFRDIAPEPVPEPDRLGRPVMMCLDLMDVHFGKLAWAPETGEDYDLKIAEQRFRLAAARLVEHCKPYALEEIVVPLGNDLCHIDTPANTTTAGTQMDVDGRQHKIIKAVVTAFRGLVDYLLTKGKTVRVLSVPGNHDWQATFYLTEIIAGFYHNEPRVIVDNGPTSRKYVAWGKNLIGFTHGKEIKDPRDLTAVMINERPNEFVNAVSREWHLGHLHQHRSTERHGVICRILRSLSGTDAHHFNFGYVGNRKAAEAFIYDETDGLLANFIAGGE